MTTDLFPNITLEDALDRPAAGIDRDALETARRIVDRVRTDGDRALDGLTTEFGDREPREALIVPPAELAAALNAMPRGDRGRLERIADRIRTFAVAQRDGLTSISVGVPGGTAGHTIVPLHRAGCYAPGGRYPLPSSVLMTAVTARAAGVASVWVASPRPTPVTMAAAAVAGADGLVRAGGAQAIAAMAFGTESIPRCDIVVGPGNRYVTAAKQLVFGTCQIDMLAGPSELVVLADETATPSLVAADLLAQAEHDTDAVPIMVTTSSALGNRVREELTAQLASLPTADTARAALRNGGVIVVSGRDEALATCDALAPEHLELCVDDAPAALRGLRNYGAAFVSEGSAEVFGDYGIGPNHVLPTGGTARSFGGLSVLSFLRTSTWLHLDERPEQEVVDDMIWMARVEGLEAHARAAEARG